MLNCVHLGQFGGVIALVPPFSASPILLPPFADCEGARYEINSPIYWDEGYSQM